MVTEGLEDPERSKLDRDKAPFGADDSLQHQRPGHGPRTPGSTPVMDY